MQLVAPLDRSMHRPFRIGDGDSESGPRLGGRAPALEYALPLASGSQYVLTFPLIEQPMVFASVFVMEASTYSGSMNDGVQSDDRILVVRHGAVFRTRSDRFASELSAHPLLVSPQVSNDLVDDGEGRQIISSDHKFGGRPCCIHELELQGADLAFERGFIQALQLDFPGYSDGNVSGNWPFADGLFNLFLKPDDPDLVCWAFQA